MKLFMDSSAYIAFYNERDEKHCEAERFIDEVKKGFFGPVIFTQRTMCLMKLSPR